MRERDRVRRVALRSDPERFRDVRAWVADLARRAGQDVAWGRKFALALHEAMTNVHRHAYGGRLDGRIDIRAEILDDALEIRVRDYGPRFEPTAHAAPPPHAPSEAGGYGIALMRASVDEVAYLPAAHGTEIVLRKRCLKTTIPAAPSGAGEGARR